MNSLGTGSLIADRMLKSAARSGGDPKMAVAALLVLQYQRGLCDQSTVDAYLKSRGLPGIESHGWNEA